MAKPCFSWLLLGLVIALSQECTVAKTTTFDDIQKVLKAVEFHHENYRRSLKELDVMLENLPESQLKLLKTKTRISKRSEINQLFSSFLAFCNNLKNETKSEVKQRHRSKENLETTQRVVTNRPIDIEQYNDTVDVFPRIWHKPDIRFEPLALRARGVKNDLFVEVLVRQRVPLYAYPSLYLHHLYPVQPCEKQFLPNENNQTKDTITRFKINVEKCSSKRRYEGPSVQLWFSELDIYGSTSFISVNPCHSMPLGSEWKEYKLSIIEFEWTLPNKIILNESGRKTIFDVRLINQTSISFQTSTLEFNKDHDRVFSKNTFVTKSHENDCNLEKITFSTEEEYDSMLDIQLCSKKTEKSDPVQPFTEVRVIVDGNLTKSGGIYLSQNLEIGENSLIESYIYFRGVKVSRGRTTEPIPHGKISFEGQSKFLCDTNPVTAKRNEREICGIYCFVISGDLAQVTILKGKKDYSGENSRDFEFRSIVNELSGEAVLKFIEVNPKNAGEYKCRATTKSGHIEERTTTLIVGGQPNIEYDNFTVSLKDGFVQVTCNATGSDLRMSVYGGKQSDGLFDLKLYPSTRAGLERLSPNEFSYKMKVLQEDLQKSMFDVLKCVAVNDISNSTVSHYNIQGLFNYRS